LNILVDENLPRSLAPQIAELGFRVQDVRDIGLRGRSDTEVMATATAMEGLFKVLCQTSLEINFRLKAQTRLNGLKSCSAGVLVS
jgi:hypothetical protein